jgi:parallel beta-helix repeat protein
MAIYTIGSGETYETFADLIAAVTLGPGDIVRGKNETFTEDWPPNGSGSLGNRIVLERATLNDAGGESYGVDLNNRIYITSLVHVSNATVAGININDGRNHIIGQSSLGKLNIADCARGVYAHTNAYNLSIRYLNITDSTLKGVEVQNCSFIGLLFLDISGTLNGNPGVYLLNVTSSAYNSISVIDSSNNTGKGFEADSSRLLFTSCDFDNNGGDGLYLVDCLPAIGPSYSLNKVSCNGNFGNGIHFLRCDGVNIDGQTATLNNNIFNGVYINDSDNLTIYRVTVNNNGTYGIHFKNSDNIIASYLNLLNHSAAYGIYVDTCDDFSGDNLNFDSNILGCLVANSLRSILEDSVAIKSTSYDGFRINDSNDAVLRRCRAGTYGVPGDGNATHGIHINDSNDATLEDCEAYHNSSGGILADAGSDNTDILRCNVQNNSPLGIEIAGLNQNIEYSCCANNGGNNGGVYCAVANTTGNLHNMTLFQNVIYNTILGAGPVTGLNFDIRNCIMTTGWASQNFWLISIYNVSSTFTIDYNCYWHYDPTFNILTDTPFFINGNPQTWAQWQAAGYDANSVFINPQFVDPGNGIFTLQFGSPLIGAGDYSIVSPGDTYLDGAAVGDSEVNMGAYSSQGSPEGFAGGFTFKLHDHRFTTSQGGYDARRRR